MKYASTFSRSVSHDTGPRPAHLKKSVDIERAHRLLIQNAADGLGEQLRHRQLADAGGAPGLGAERNRVRDDELIERGLHDLLHRASREHRVRDVAHHLHGALLLQCLRRLAERARGVDQIVDQDAGLSLDLADDVHHLGFVRPRAALVDDRQLRIVEPLGEGPRARHAADVRRHDDDVPVRTLPRIAEQHRGGIHVVHRDVEEALDLLRVQVDRQQPVDARAREHVGDQLRRDRRARALDAPVLARVAEVRHHRGDARGRGAPAGIHHHEQLHETVVRRRAGRLHDEYVASAHVLHELDVDLAVAEAPDVDAPERVLEGLDHVLRQRRVRIACEQRERVAGTVVGRAHNCCAARFCPPALNAAACHQARQVSKTGWGGRIRTSEWRDQNPLPYHLATPQHPSLLPSAPHPCGWEAGAHLTPPHPPRVCRRSSWSGERSRPRATKLPQRSGTRPASRSASAALSNAVKTHEPVPVRRAGATRESHSSASATSGERERTTASQSLRPPDSKKARIVMRGEFRVNSGLWNTSRVLTATPGWIMTYHLEGSVTGVSRSPTPSAQAEEPTTKTGTSAPTVAPRAASSPSASRQSQSSFSTRSAVAASELPPPRPDPRGMRLRTLRLAPSRVPEASCKARAARTVRSASGARSFGPSGRSIRPSSRTLIWSVSVRSMS